MAEPKWEWMDTTFGLIVGVFTTVAGMIGWINPRLTKLEDKLEKKCQTLQAEMDRKVDEVHSRVSPLAEDVAALLAHQDSDRDRLAGIDAKLGRIEEHLMNGKR